MTIPTVSDRLAAKNIIITGASGGIGAAFARHLVAAGASVAVADLDLAAAEAIAAELRSTGARAVAVPVDVTDPDSVRAMFDSAEAELGQVSVLFNNAGVCMRQPFLEITEAQWKLMHTVNGKGTLFCTQEAARRFIPRGGGKVINTCSTSSRQASADFAAYAASKAATLSVTQSAARALGQHGITVNAIGPGIIDTDLWSRVERDDSGAEVLPADGDDAARPRLDAYESQILLGRTGTPDDIAPTAVFLASSDSDYITGQLLMVDGGIVIQ